MAQILPPSALAAPAWQAGDVVLGARLEEVVGQGSAATVWRARSADGDLVAVKLFDTTKCNVGLTLPAYRRGVQVMNRLTALSDRLPPTVARLRCVSLNLLGFVTDLAAEGSAVSLPARAWPPERSVAFFRKLCGAVAAAHDEGVLHRCIKPSNILLDAALDPVLTDFDTADLPALAAGSADACGYRPYAAPEELAGGGTQSPTADIYALGRLLEFLLLGRDPDAGAQPGAELEAQGGVPEGLVRIARKCTMPAPEERYQWVGDLLEDLDGHESAEFVGLGRDEAPAPVPYGVSALAPRTPWLGRLRRAVRRSAPPPLAAAPGPSTTSPPRSGRRRLWPRRLWPRRAPASVAAAGAALLVGSVLAAALAPRPSEALLDALRLVTALGAAGVSLLMSPLRVAPRASRVLAAAACALLVYLADFPELAAPPASRAPVERGSGAP
ncbi:MAG: hypothetical protein HY744_23020 [Deltaproteobacteria bacterium]|nr:hypothetical protein [Deltaproteobacteria bacterium]